MGKFWSLLDVFFRFHGTHTTITIPLTLLLALRFLRSLLFKMLSSFVEFRAG